MQSPPGDRGGRESSPPGALRTPPGTCDLLVLLAELRHYTLKIDRRCKLFFAQRKPVPFTSPAEIETCFGEIETYLAPIPRKRYVLLVDTRSAPLRNDPGFEALLETHRGKLLFGFAKNAALARTAAGRLQIERFARSDSRRVFVTREPAEAFEFLGIPKHEL